MAGSDTKARAADWRRQTEGLKQSAVAWRESENERRSVFRALVKPAAALGVDLKAMTAAGRDAFDKRCAELDAQAKKRAPKKPAPKAASNAAPKRTQAKR